jgi:hypothetical protein
LRLIYIYYENKKKVESKKGEKRLKICKNFKLFKNFYFFIYSVSNIEKGTMETSIFLIVRDIADLIIAINYLPSGFLWSTKLVHYQIGFLGMFSATFRIHTYVWNF